jgi:hypothetical protein
MKTIKSEALPRVSRAVADLTLTAEGASLGEPYPRAAIMSNTKLLLRNKLLREKVGSRVERMSVQRAHRGDRNTDYTFKSILQTRSEIVILRID